MLLTRDDGRTVELRFPSDDRPSVRYGDGPWHRLLNTEHADQVREALRIAGYEESDSE